MGLGLVDWTRLPLRGLKRPVAVDYDPVEKMIYWSDLQSLPTAKISRAHLNGSNQVTFVDDLRLPDGLALDLEARILYWTDGIIGQIGRITMDGRGAKEIIIENLDKPRTIVIDPSGYIYWTDWGDNPRIERARLDGSGRETIIAGRLVWPNGVEVDSARNYLFWCDASLDKIERSDLLGNDRVLLVNLTQYDNIHPFDLAVYGDYVYWTDWGYSVLLRVHESGRGEQPYGPQTFQRAGGLHIHKEPNFCDSRPCQNGGSCENVINGFSCTCGPGFKGTVCESSDDPCDSQPCMNGGVCARLSDGFTCQCSAGYQGPTCATDLCQSKPCMNGGNCTRTPGGFSCRCPASYDGITCGKRRRGCSAPPQTPHTVLVQSDVTFFEAGEEANFICDRGYFIGDSDDRSALRLCRSDGTWSGKQVECYSKPDKGSSSIPVEAIGGGAGGIFLILVLIVALVCFKRNKSRNNCGRVVHAPAMTYMSELEHREELLPPYCNPIYQEVEYSRNVQAKYCSQIQMATPPAPPPVLPKPSKQMCSERQEPTGYMFMKTVN